MGWTEGARGTKGGSYDVGAGVEGGRDCLREGGLIMERARKGRNEAWTERRK